LIRCFFVLCLALLAGCATPALVPPEGVRPQADQFSLSARFVLRIESPGEPLQQWSGRLQWQHDRTGDTLLFVDPFGQGVAELISTSSGASLRLASGETHNAPDAESLLTDRLGFPLPLARLPDWLFGRASAAGKLAVDTSRRPSSLSEQGWAIEYAYDDSSAAALPARLTVRRDNALELRLRIEAWQ